MKGMNMALCRWSSMDFKCDVYLYEHVGGYWALHVAGMRIITPLPPVPHILQSTTEEFMAAYNARQRALETCKRERINHQFAGETFELPDIPAVIEKLELLRAEGFHFPDDVIPLLREELADLEEAANPRAHAPDAEE